MSEWDKEFLEGLDYYGAKQARLADVLGVSRQAVHTGVNQGSDYFTLERLAKLVRNEKGQEFVMDDPFQNEKCRELILKAYLKRSCQASGLAPKRLAELLNTTMSFCTQGAGAWLWVAEPASSETLAEMLRPQGPFRELVIGVEPALTDAAITALQTWALGPTGNFADRLQVEVVALAESPLADMVGAFEGAEFRGFIETGEGFIPMVDPVLDELHQHLAALARHELKDGDQRQWALPTTPEARIVELLLRDLGQELPPAARDVLRAQQAAFETDDASANVGESAWTRISQALSGDELRNSAGSEAVLQVRHALEAAKLARI